MRRNPIHMQQLKCAQPEHQRNRLGKPLVRTLQKPPHIRIQRDLPPQHAHYQRRRQMPISLRERVHANAMQQLIAMSFAISDER